MALMSPQSTMVAAGRDPWSVSEFEQRLRGIGETRYHDKHPFHQRMHAGELSRTELRCWTLNRFCYQRALPVKDALIVSKLPSREDRRAWLRRIVDHDGAVEGVGGLERWVQLGAAMGLPEQVLWSGQGVVPAVRFAVSSYVGFCRDRPWLEAVGASLTELFAPDLLSARVKVIETQYPWVDPAGLAYFRHRLTEQPRDIAHVLDLVLTHANTAEGQNAVLAALEFKCDVLWALLDGIAAAPGDPDPDSA
jgi:pyrroloquinoline-quinone synthase